MSKFYVIESRMNEEPKLHVVEASNVDVALVIVDNRSRGVIPEDDEHPVGDAYEYGDLGGYKYAIASAEDRDGSDWVEYIGIGPIAED